MIEDCWVNTTTVRQDMVDTDELLRGMSGLNNKGVKSLGARTAHSR